MTDLDLEAQIALAEQAVIARDARIRRRADQITHRLRRDVMRHAGGGLAVGLGTLALGWWLRRRNASAAPPPAAPAAGTAPEDGHFARDAGLSLAALIPLIWPLLPRSVRRSVTPGTASTLLTFLAPIFARLFRRKPGPA